MSALTNYAENKLIDRVIRGQAGTFPTNWYVGLLTAAPSDAGAGTEVTGGSYARVAVSANAASWAATDAAGSTVATSAGTTGTTSNNADVNFPTPSAGWGTITHFGVYDAASAGNLWWYGGLTVSKQVFSGDPVKFLAGTLSFQIDN